MNKKVWAFGDSFTQSMAPIPTLDDWRLKYSKFKGYSPKVFTDFLDEYGYECINRGHGGADNYTIIDIIINHLDKINDGDIVIIGWSSISRSRLANKFGKYTTILPGGDESFQKETAKLIGVSVKTVEDILANRTESACYITELNRYIKLINHTFRNNIVLHWSPFFFFHQGMDVVSIPPIETIKKETDGEVQDSHYSENGHQTLAEHLNQLIHYTIRHNDDLLREDENILPKETVKKPKNLI